MPGLVLLWLQKERGPGPQFVPSLQTPGLTLSSPCSLLLPLVPFAKHICEASWLPSAIRLPQAAVTRDNGPQSQGVVSHLDLRTKKTRENPTLRLSSVEAQDQMASPHTQLPAALSTKLCKHVRYHVRLTVSLRKYF